MKIIKISNKKASYVGNCANLFDSKSGYCLIDIFNNVSDFANKEEEVRNLIDDGNDILLSFEEFSSLVDFRGILDKNTENFEFYFYPETDFSPQIYVAYDVAEDIHYFFK
jgi:hypothetical protein